MAKRKRLGEILIEAGVIDESQLKMALDYQKKWGGRLGRVLVDNDWLSHEALVEAIQLQTGIEMIDLENIKMENEVIELVPVDLAERHTLLPVELKAEAGRSGETLVLAVSDPTDLNAHDEVQFYTGKKIKLMLASEPAIASAIKRFYHGQFLDEMSEDFFQSGTSDVQFGGQEIDPDNFIIEDGQLESASRETAGEQKKEEPSENQPDWSSGDFDDPFAELSKAAASAETRSPNIVDPVQALVSDPVQALVPDPAQAIEPDPAQLLGPDPTQELEPDPFQALGPDPAQELEPDPFQALEPDPAQELEPDPVQAIEPDPFQTLGPDPTQELEPDPFQALEPDPAQALEPDPVQMLGQESFRTLESEPVHEAVQDFDHAEKAPLVEDLPEVEIVEDLPWDAASSQASPKPEQMYAAQLENNIIKDQESSVDPAVVDPVTIPEDPQSPVVENAQTDEGLFSEAAEQIEDVTDSIQNQETFLSEKPKPLADSSWLNESLTDNEYDFFDSVPTNSEAFGESGDLLGSEPLLKEKAEDELVQDEPEIDEKQDEEIQEIDENLDDEMQTHVQTDQFDVATGHKPPKEVDLSQSKMMHSDKEITLIDDVQKIRIEAVSENRKLENHLLEESLPEEPSHSFVVKLADEVQKLIDGLESDEINEEPPTMIKSSHLIAAVIRLLLKRGIFSEVDLLEELKQR